MNERSSDFRSSRRRLRRRRGGCRSIHRLVAAAAMLTCAVVAHGSEPLLNPTRLSIGATPLSFAFVADETTARSADLAPSLSTAFGTADTWRLNLLGGVISDFSTTTGGEFRAEFEYFLIERFSLVPVLELGGFVQDGGEDPLMVAGALLLRWHFLAGEDWTIFADAGCGLAYLTADLPPDTNSIKFNPQIGVGFTLAVTPGSEARLMGGVRWYHLSNARTASSNEGFDGAEAYLGLSIPF